MNSLPLHPGIVHIPLGLAIILPLIVILAIVLIKKYNTHKPIWLTVVALQLILTISALVAMKTGENEEDLVKQVIDKSIIHEHEEKAEAFAYTSILVLLVSGSLLVIKNTKIIPSLRYTVLALQFVLLILAYKTGQAGGELVYKHNAPEAYKENNK